VKVFSGARYQFSGPTAMATDGGDVFVLETLGGRVTELNASTGALVRLVPPAWYGFSSPNAMVRHGDELYVLNFDQTEGVTVLNASNGAAMGVLSGGFDFPEALADYGDDLFVASSNGSSVIEVNASTGTLVRQLSGPSYRFDSLGPMVVDKDDLFVASGDELCASPPYGCPNFAVTEVNANSGAVVRVISGGSFDYPDAMVVDGADLFVANAALSGKGGEPSVMEVNQATGAVVRVISGRTYKFDGPDAMVVDGPDLFVLNSDGNSVTELPG
jgi:outer membrane protein assembly factor BamB